MHPDSTHSAGETVPTQARSLPCRVRENPADGNTPWQSSDRGDPGRGPAMLRYEADSDADPGQAWALLARPGRWHEWAPQLRGAWGLGVPEVQRGASGVAFLLGVVPVPATITAVA